MTRAQGVVILAGQRRPERMNEHCAGVLATVRPGIALMLPGQSCPCGTDGSMRPALVMETGELSIVPAGRRCPEGTTRIRAAPIAAAPAPRRALRANGPVVFAGRSRPGRLIYSGRRLMGRKSKSDKRKRSEGIIDGIRKYLDASAAITIKGQTYTSADLIAVFEEHLQALADVDDLTIRRSIAIAKERAILARIAPLMTALKSFLIAYFDPAAPELREFGFEPNKKPRMTAETKRRANEKRQATRKERGIMGRKQRARAKKGT